MKPVVSLAEIREAQAITRTVQVEDSILDYLQDIVDQTRTSNELQVGTSTRGALAFYRAAQATALLAGRDFVVPDDVKKMAVPVLAHRVMPRGFAAGSERTAAEAIIQKCLEAVRVPT